MKDKRKVYLDFQIIDRCNKSPEMLKKLESIDNTYYCSVSHIEELYRAIKNAEKSNTENRNKNIELAKGLKEVLDKLCAKGILNPGNGAIEFREESIENCFNRIRKHDTIKQVYENAQRLKDSDAYSPHFSRNYYESKKIWQDIWEENIIKEEIINRNKEAQLIKVLAMCNMEKLPSSLKHLYEQLEEIYGAETAKKEINSYINAIVYIEPGIYEKIKCNFKKIEYLIECLSRILYKCGYKRDAKLNLVNSGEYDISHLIYATACDLFVTNDEKLRLRAKAIYYFIGAPVDVLSLDEYCS